MANGALLYEVKCTIRLFVSAEGHLWNRIMKELRLGSSSR